MLGPLGISEFDERVYRALLGQADRAADIAGAIGSTPSRVRQALGRLTGLGLARRVARGSYEPTRPRAALTSLLNQRRMRAESAFSQVQFAMEDLAHEYQAGRIRTDPGSLVQVLSGRDTVIRTVTELTRTVSTHLWVLDTPPYLEWANGLPDTNENEMEVTLGMINRGVDVRAVYSPEALERPGRFDIVVKLAGLGEQSRLLPSLPFKLRILDRQLALVPLVGGLYDDLAVVHPSGLLDALIELFEAYWTRATPVIAGHPPAEDTPGEEDLLILHMLRTGLKDEAIARQLGVSARTATRRIAAIMVLLGATSRFQAGVEAVGRGWL